MHGGLRYLQQKEFRLVYENLYERQIILRNAPHLVRVLPFLIPVLSRDGLINPKIARALGWALWLYDLTGGARVGKLHKRIDKEQALAHMPTMPADKLAGAYLYYDAQTDDARLTLTIARTAAEHGAVVANRAGVTGLRKDAARQGPGRDGRRRRERDRHPGPGRGERGRRVGRRRARARRGRCHPDSIRPGEGHPHHGAVGQGPQRHRRDRAGPQGQALDLRGAVGRLHLHRHDRHRLRRSARRSRSAPPTTSPTSSTR